MTEPKPVTALRGVGDALALRLRSLGVETTQDLLFLLPSRYEDRTRVVPLGELQAGQRAAVEGEVLLTEVAFRGRRQMLCKIADGSGFLTLRFFYFTAQQQNGLARGVRIRCFGEARRGPQGMEIVHPEYRRVDSSAAKAAEDHLTPIYPATEGVTQGRLRQLVGLALDQTSAHDLMDWLPAPVLEGSRLPPLRDALLYVHRPPADAPVEQLLEWRHPAQRRLAFEELLAHQLSLKLLRQRIQSDPGWPLVSDGALKADLLSGLPFQLTAAQTRVLHEIEKDLGLAKPMLRLVQGDVGCGKTLVAALAATRAVQLGRQVALMAPTELLADQHALNFKRWFEPLGVPIALLTGRQTGKARSAALAGIREGHAPIVIGTHALFQESVEFASLALVIVDEQHRFGVHQRLRLREKGGRDAHQPHQLIMTATPIPRTLAMTAYADLDVSVIDELPPGRTPVKTVVLAGTRRDEVVMRIRTACLEGRQAYWVCPLIDESEEMPYQAAEETAAALAAALPELAVGLVHGRMPSGAKESTMRRFKDGEIQLLVATTVIEVGVDVPNATLMVIENAERMGLAQLHQLRGRVGRGRHASSCLLLYRPPLSPLARERLAVMRDTNDGFVVARRDLELRGPGELLGTRQTGLAQMRVADLLRDADLLPRVQGAAEILLRDWPLHVTPLIRRWVGHAEQYGRVGKNGGMTQKAARPIQSVQWFPAERLGQMIVVSALRTWLIAKGMLSARVKAACGEDFALRLIDQWTGLLTSSHKLGLRSDDTAGLFRDIEMVRGGQVLIFGQTVMPDSTLIVHPWLAELGDTPLDETLIGLSGVDRGAYEYAWLPVDDPLTARALRDAEVKPDGLWARRSRVALRGAPLLMQEVFLPGMGRSQEPV